MEDIFLTKIIEAEQQAHQIILNSNLDAQKLIQDKKQNFENDKKQLEKKYDDLLYYSQEQIDEKLKKEFSSKLDSLKNEVDEIKNHSKENYSKAIDYLLFGVNDNGNS